MRGECSHLSILGSNRMVKSMCQRRKKEGRIFDDTLFYAEAGSMLIATGAYPSHWVPSKKPLCTVPPRYGQLLRIATSTSPTPARANLARTR